MLLILNEGIQHLQDCTALTEMICNCPGYIYGQLRMKFAQTVCENELRGERGFLICSQHGTSILRLLEGFTGKGQNFACDFHRISGWLFSFAQMAAGDQHEISRHL